MKCTDSLLCMSKAAFDSQRALKSPLPPRRRYLSRDCGQVAEPLLGSTPSLQSCAAHPQGCPRVPRCGSGGIPIPAGIEGVLRCTNKTSLVWQLRGRSWPASSWRLLRPLAGTTAAAVPTDTMRLVPTATRPPDGLIDPRSTVLPSIVHGCGRGAHGVGGTGAGAADIGVGVVVGAADVGAGAAALGVGVAAGGGVGRPSREDAMRAPTYLAEIPWLAVYVVGVVALVWLVGDWLERER
jgi:hypothetical protein